MNHPLTDIVLDLVNNRATNRLATDRFDLAIHIGAPDNDPDSWGAYLAVADHILECALREGNLDIEFHPGQKFPRYWPIADLPIYKRKY